MSNSDLFRGNNKSLISSINALLELDAKAALAPHGIGEMARDLLATCAARLPAEQHQGGPVERDERAGFEKAWAEAVNVELLDLHRKQYPLTGDEDQPYDTQQTQLGWMMWQARAALSASAEPSAPTPQTINGHKLNCKAVDDYKPGDCSCGAEPSAPKCGTCNDHGEIGCLRPDGYDGERCPDCNPATVKRYYIGKYGLVEGEALGRISVVLGADHDRVTAERDQLQADLTERDERIDQLEQQPRVPQGYALVPQSMLLSKEVIGVINFHCGDTDQEEGGQFGQYTDGRLWVGYVLDDDGNKVHGLHIATDEYPEEGSTTLVEFPELGAHQQPNQCGDCQVDKDGPKAEVMDISDLGADAICGICYDTGHMVIDDTGPEYVTTPCMECEKGQQLAAKP